MLISNTKKQPKQIVFDYSFVIKLYRGLSSESHRVWAKCVKWTRLSTGRLSESEIDLSIVWVFVHLSAGSIKKDKVKSAKGQGG